MEKIVKVMGEIVDWGFMFVGIGELIVGNSDMALILIGLSAILTNQRILINREEKVSFEIDVTEVKDGKDIEVKFLLFLKEYDNEYELFS